MLRSPLRIPLAALLAVALALLPGASPAHASAALATGSVRGIVVDGVTRRPVAQASVAIEGTALGATAGDDGRYVIANVPEGTWRVRAWRIDYPALTRADVVVTRGRTAQADFELALSALSAPSVEVRGHLFTRRPDVPTTSYQLSAEEIRRSPGAIGDVLRLVQSLPGLAMSNDQRNDIIARGGSPGENLTLVDNVEVPSLNHFATQGTSGGPISMLDNELVRDATFLAGGFPAEYGGRLSSVLDVRLREGDRERLRTLAEVHMAGAGLVSEGPMGPRGSWVASVRQSYLDLLADSFGLMAVPHTTNWQLRAQQDPGPADKLWLLALGGRDDIHVKPKLDDASDPNLVDAAVSGWRQITGVNWQHLFGTRGWGTLGVSDAISRFHVDAYDGERDGALGFRNRSDEGETTLKLDAALRGGSRADWKAGALVRRHRDTFGVTQPFGFHDPFSTDTAYVGAIDVERTLNTWAGSAYVQTTLHAGPRLDLTLGAVGERFGAIGANTLSPRTGLVLHTTRAVDLSFSYGRYRQMPALVYVAAWPENRGLEPMRADHWVAGVQAMPQPDVRVTLEAYVKTYTEYPVARDYPVLSLANTGDQYGVWGLLLPFVSAGRGRARGIEFYAQKKLTGRWYGQLSYSYSRTEHAALDGVMRRGGFDAPHVATLIAGFHASRQWQLSSRWSFASGRPFTPPLEPVSTDQNRYVLDLARVNGARAKNYARLDLRVDRHVPVRGTEWTWFLETQNVFDRRNVFQYVWNPKTRALQALDQVHLFPVGGMTVKF